MIAMAGEPPARPYMMVSRFRGKDAVVPRASYLVPSTLYLTLYSIGVSIVIITVRL